MQSQLLFFFQEVEIKEVRKTINTQTKEVQSLQKKITSKVFWSFFHYMYFISVQNHLLYLKMFVIFWTCMFAKLCFALGGNLTNQMALP